MHVSAHRSEVVGKSYYMWSTTAAFGLKHILPWTYRTISYNGIDTRGLHPLYKSVCDITTPGDYPWEPADDDMLPCSMCTQTVRELKYKITGWDE